MEGEWEGEREREALHERIGHMCGLNESQLEIEWEGEREIEALHESFGHLWCLDEF